MKQHKHKQDGLQPTRRQFGKTLALLAAASWVAGAGPANAAQANETLAATASRLSKIVELRYGNFLTQEQKSLVRRRIASQLRSAQRLKKFKFAKGEEPAFIFQADVP